MNAEADKALRTAREAGRRDALYQVPNPTPPGGGWQQPGEGSMSRGMQMLRDEYERGYAEALEEREEHMRIAAKESAAVLAQKERRREQEAHARRRRQQQRER